MVVVGVALLHSVGENFKKNFTIGMIIYENVFK